MQLEPLAWPALCGVALTLGARHGFDADHVASIDGLVRWNARARPRLARNAGFLFALGHGAIVVTVAAAASLISERWRAPHWLDVVGVAVSSALLFGLAIVNLLAAIRPASGRAAVPVGMKSTLFRRLLVAERPLTIGAVGALFALSLDTISLAALFAFAVRPLGGSTGDALLVASLFVSGMVVVDGFNGVLIHGLLRRADQFAAAASRIMMLAVAGTSFMVGLLVLCRYVVPSADVWLSNHEGAISAAVALTALAGFAVALMVAAWSGKRHRRVTEVL